MFGNKKQNLGFTLIEVMIASVILFSVIAVLGLIYKGVVTSSLKASNHVKISLAAPFIEKRIKTLIFDESNTKPLFLEGKGTEFNIQYEWVANSIDYQSPPVSFDPESGKLIEHPKRYRLWEVNLNLKYLSTLQSYTYTEVSWHE